MKPNWHKKGRLARWLTGWARVWGVGVLLLWGAAQVAAQGGNTFYLYDDDGRLRVVVSPNGEAAIYEYDPAGNIMAIRRLTQNDLEILGFAPRQGLPGTSVTIYGTGFNQGVSAVAFNGTPATIVATTLGSVTALVPNGATTGPIRVETPRGPAVSSSPFVVKGVRLTPQALTLPALETVQFGLDIAGTPTNAATWSVNGVTGGGANLGTITASGFYTAPNLTGGNIVQYTVRATSVDDPLLFGESVVTVIPFGAGFQFRSEGVSVRYGTPPNNAPTYTNGAVSVRYGTPPNNAPTEANGAVSVRYGTPANNPPTDTDGAVSVRYGTPANTPPTYVNGAVSASRGPALTSLSTGALERGATAAMTINGAGFHAARSVTFYRLADGNPADNITTSNIKVNEAGTSLTVSVKVSSEAATGRYVVVVTTPAGATARAETTANIVQIN